MGHSQEDKAASHERIVTIAAARFREAGTDSPAIGDLMRAAELTHGGFYRHFGSRDELVDEAVELALRTGAGRMADAAEKGAAAGDGLGALIDGYLSAGHRDEPASSCAVATLSADVARGSDRARAAYTNQVRGYLDMIEASITEPDPVRRRRRALQTLSALVGAVLMARAVDSAVLSDELLTEVAEALREG
ncbi:TetR/AcrR family transcriptional regulator [Pseudonocardia spinosispora]|uniref:TetR/AcrR family transcriptional regulator n=1 Tax=Pseudonocardia spinosispora TaxID=103441 RepID=UPI0003F8C6DA|nr:TetR/AcrR family transcriptional regulator [Pseudonocardia spinosispora]